MVGAILVALGPLAHRQYVKTQRQKSLDDMQVVMFGFGDYDEIFDGKWVPRVHRNIWNRKSDSYKTPLQSTTNVDEVPGTSWRFFMHKYLDNDRQDTHSWRYDYTNWQADVNADWRAWQPTRICLEPDSSNTSIVAIEGPDTFFEPKEPRQPDLVAVIEMYDSGINWLEPRDFEYLSRNIPDETPVREVIHGREPTSITVGFADYESWCLDGTLPFGALKKFFTNASAKKYDREKELGPYKLYHHDTLDLSEKP